VVSTYLPVRGVGGFSYPSHRYAPCAIHANHRHPAPTQTLSVRPFEPPTPLKRLATLSGPDWTSSHFYSRSCNLRSLRQPPSTDRRTPRRPTSSLLPTPVPACPHEEHGAAQHVVAADSLRSRLNSRVRQLTSSSHIHPARRLNTGAHHRHRIKWPCFCPQANSA
jgi:hypothetical protein